MTTTFETASIGDRVWSLERGWGKIRSLGEEVTYPIGVEFPDEYPLCYTLGGKRLITHGRQTLFWDEVEIEAPTKPLPKLAKDACLEVWSPLNPTITFNRHFSHFEGGVVYCFENGGTSWTTSKTIPWYHWRKPE